MTSPNPPRRPKYHLHFSWDLGVTTAPSPFGGSGQGGLSAPPPPPPRTHTIENVGAPAHQHWRIAPHVQRPGWAICHLCSEWRRRCGPPRITRRLLLSAMPRHHRPPWQTWSSWAELGTSPPPPALFKKSVFSTTSYQINHPADVGRSKPGRPAYGGKRHIPPLFGPIRV